MRRRKDNNISFIISIKSTLCWLSNIVAYSFSNYFNEYAMMNLETVLNIL